MDDLREWLLLIYRVPTEPARKRTYVWRKLRGLGAVYLQQAVALLPRLPALEEQAEALAQRIREFEGEVTLLRTRSTSLEWEREIVAQFNQARDEEYAEIEEGAGRIVHELERESGRGQFSFAELEENEEGMAGLRRWLSRVRERDFFGAAGQATAASSLEEAAVRLQEFADRVYQGSEGTQA